MATGTALSEHVLADADDERRRLTSQAALLEDDARSLLGRLEVPVGGDVIDIGCGPIGILPLLSERVGAHGQVTGFDRQGDLLDHAAQACTGLRNVRFALGDATDTGFARRSFDLAHIRLLLTHVPDPMAVVREAVGIVRPGGTVAVQEPDWLSWQCEPDVPAWTTLRGVLVAFWHANGFDPCIGRRLPGMLRNAGLREVGVAVLGGIDGAGHPNRRSLVTVADRCRGRIVDSGIATAGDLDDLIRTVDRHLADPDAVVVRAMTVQAWGRVPGHGGVRR